MDDGQRLISTYTNNRYLHFIFDCDKIPQVRFLHSWRSVVSEGG